MATLTLNLLYLKLLKFSPKKKSKNNILWKKLEYIFELFYLSTLNLQINQLFNKHVLKADERGRLNGFVVGI